jgi:hypothetical protein
MQVSNFLTNNIKNEDCFYQKSNILCSTNSKSNKIGKIKMHELDNTLSEKFTKTKNLKRVSPSKRKDSNATEVKKNEKSINVKKTLTSANKLYDQKQYAKAAKLYESVINTSEAKNYLAKVSYNAIFQDIYLCHNNIWKQSSGDQKEKNFQTVFKSLFPLLQIQEDQTTTDLFLDFADELYPDALSQIGKNNDLAFDKLCLLMDIDLMFKDKITGVDINALFKNILFNMTVCIHNNGNVDTKMLERMFILLVGNKGIDQDLKVEYLDWLEDNCGISEEESFEESQSKEEVHAAANALLQLNKRPGADDDLQLSIKKRKVD